MNQRQDNTPLRLRAILRESSRPQLKGHGRERQEHLEIERYAHEIGATIIDTRFVVERASVFDRPQYQAVQAEAIRDRGRGAIDGIVLPSVDRLSRDPYDGGAVVKDALVAGLELHFAAERLCANRLEDQAAIVGALTAARAYVERLKRQTIPARRAKAERGMIPNGQHQWPYDYVADKGSPNYGKAFPNAERAALVRKWGEILLAGGTIAAIQRYLTDKGIPSPKGARVWSRSTITRILNNPACKGEFYGLYEEMISENFYEPSKRARRSPQLIYQDKEHAILDDATWQAVQERLTANRQLAVRNTRRDYTPLHRRVRCGKCRRAMTVDSHKRWPRFVCPLCGAGFNVRKLWGIVRWDLIEYLGDPFRLEALLRENISGGYSAKTMMAELKEREHQVKTARTRRERASRMLVEFPDNPTFKDIIRECTLDIERLEAEMNDRRRNLSRLEHLELERTWEALRLYAVALSVRIENATDAEWRVILRSIEFEVEYRGLKEKPGYSMRVIPTSADAEVLAHVGLQRETPRNAQARENALQESSQPQRNRLRIPFTVHTGTRGGQP